MRGDGGEIVLLASGLRHDGSTHAGQDDPSVPVGGGQLGARLRRDTIDVFRRDRLAHAREVDEPLHHRGRPFDLLECAAERQGLAAEGGADTERALEFEEVHVVDAAKQQRVGAFGGDAMDDVVGVSLHQ